MTNVVPFAGGVFWGHLGRFYLLLWEGQFIPNYCQNIDCSIQHSESATSLSRRLANVGVFYHWLRFCMTNQVA